MRLSNFELLRLVSMLMVMVGHAIGYMQEIDLVGISGVGKLVINQLCLVCVNVFVMISGWFGIKASWKGVGSLLFQVIFLASLCYLIFLALGLPVSFKENYLPYLLFGARYWFVVSYIILYALSSVLNAFAEKASEKEFRLTLIFFFLAEFIYGFLLDKGHFDYGFSPLAFIGLYLLSKYARLYPGKLFSLDKWANLSIYIGVSVLSMIAIWFGYKWFGMGFHLNHYDSPLAIVASLYFLLFFSKLRFQSKAINWLAISAFAIYLIHENNLVSPYFHKMMDHISHNLQLGEYYISLLLILIGIGFICILIDKIRLLTWRLIANTKKTSSP